MCSHVTLAHCHLRNQQRLPLLSNHVRNAGPYSAGAISAVCLYCLVVQRVFSPPSHSCHSFRCVELSALSVAGSSVVLRQSSVVDWKRWWEGRGIDRVEEKTTSEFY